MITTASSCIKYNKLRAGENRNMHISVDNNTTPQHIFLIGAKSIGQYGGYETFVDKLTEYHQNNKRIKYHIACKSNGDGHMDEEKTPGAIKISEFEFEYHNAHCFKLTVPNIGSAAAIYYDLSAFHYCIQYCNKNQIDRPIFYLMACRIGPFINYYVRQLKKINGKLYLNPDGHEWKRSKWNKCIRKYWKISEKFMVKHSDTVVCDSIHIEKYIKQRYQKYFPKTKYIAYGADTKHSILNDNDEKYRSWLNRHGLRPYDYYLIVGRFVPENNFETMIREFMESKSLKTLVLITNVNQKFLLKLEKTLNFKTDPRIKFVGTVYDAELLKKIRENAYGYLHGHSVGGTNPSLLEALAATDLNLLLDVGFNREVATESAFYWKKDKGSLSHLINLTDSMSTEDKLSLGTKARQRIRTTYSWQFIADLYENLWLESYGK